ncbi:hypothetical protein ASPCAL05050 [Aspergillus calidoustus]|uniref:FAD-binding PCMH-type domain-containing protein n=1 Tax=Aspergillus calidoustus TaxID=454130 RepID=A0A0U5C6I6_ASPCI|nr:hypothetical protein ASPCAL05050 [Aspergillus calidoustus]
MQPIFRNGPDSDTYEKARTSRLFNARIPARYPTAIVLARHEGDIIEAVTLARVHRLQISIRSGGHSYAAWSLRPRSVLVDLGGLRHCELNEGSGVVSVSPSITAQQLYDYLAERGRTFPVGHCPDVGLGGFLLGGGMGWDQPNLGWACQHILAVDLVTATDDPKLLRADAHQNTDLFWAARGGGPAFPGIVTTFHLQTFPAPKVMRSSGYVYGVGEYSRVFRWALKIAAEFEDSIEIVAIGSYKDGIEHPCITIALIASGNDQEHLDDILKSIEETHPPNPISRWFNQETTLSEQFDLKAKSYPKNHRYYVDNAFVKNDADVASTLERAFTTLPTRESLALWTSLVPLSRRQLPDMALSMQSDHYFALYAIWGDGSKDSQCMTWVDQIMEDVAKDSVGSYLGELDFRSRNTRYWGDGVWERLMEVRKKWDPENRICGCLGLEGLLQMDS